MLSMALLSPWGKVRALGDLFARRPPSPTSDAALDESVFAFARRHFGREVAERIVAPALLGVSAGDAASTSVSAMFPRLREFERAHGSVIRGMIGSRATPGRLSAFGAAGMQRLTNRLAELLGARIRYATPVQRLEPLANGWRVHSGADALDVDEVIVTAPSDAAATMLADCDASLADELRDIPYAPMRVAGIGFRAADVPAPLDGFGFLAARGAGVRILGALYTSTIAVGQAPPDTAYLRTFLGGTTDPGAIDLDADAARAAVLADLATTLGIRAEPLAYHEVVWPRAIPQYRLDHPTRLGRIDARVALHPGLALGGNAYRGLGVGDTVNDAVAIANRLLTRG
jgi:oxygen-dependent protoporphyrinogen oxidase